MSITVVQGSRLIGPIDRSDNLGHYFENLHMSHGQTHNKLKDLVENLSRSPTLQTLAAVGAVALSLYLALRKPNGVQP